jgi:hypothetical protein
MKAPGWGAPRAWGDHTGVTKDATVRIARKMLWWQVGSGRSAQC